jgi:hypothetical protein
MGRACVIHGDEEKCVQGFGGKPVGKRRLEDPEVDERIMLKWMLK